MSTLSYELVIEMWTSRCLGRYQIQVRQPDAQALKATLNSITETITQIASILKWGQLHGESKDAEDAFVYHFRILDTLTNGCAKTITEWMVHNVRSLGKDTVWSMVCIRG